MNDWDNRHKDFAAGPHVRAIEDFTTQFNAFLAERKVKLIHHSGYSEDSDGERHDYESYWFEGPGFSVGIDDLAKEEGE